MDKYNFKNFFYQMPANLLRIFSGRNLLWHGLAIILTLFIVLSGFDWIYFSYLNGTFTQRFFFLAVGLGGIVPLVLPLALWAYSKAKKNLEMAYASFALGQGGMAGYLISIFYKALTGRAHPALRTAEIMDTTREWSFGIWRGGVFWGWPSSHTAVAFGTAFALIALFPEKRKLREWAFIYALFIGVGISMSIHWFSDFVAGAILGALAGTVVGLSFRSLRPLRQVRVSDK